MVLIYLLAGGLVVTMLKDLYLLARTFSFIYPETHSDEWPMVSILVAARNEEATIERCLAALTKQNYPADKLEILVGNDLSEDRTLEVAQKIAQQDSRIQVLDIQTLVVEAHGKMNVLVQLIEKASGDVYLFTDADTEVNPEWTTCMTSALLSGYGVVTGVSLMQARTAFEKCQYMDWLLAQGMVKVLEDQGTRVTSLGNNMGVTKEAYDRVGGFHGVTFSITEDYELYCAIIDHGHKPVHIYSEKALGLTLPMPSVRTLLEQRKRWMFGVVKLPRVIIFFLLLNALFVPLAGLLIYLAPVPGMLLALGRLFIHWMFSRRLQRLLSSPLSSGWLIAFEFYQAFINLTTLIYFLSPIKATWKGRTFS